MNRRLDAHHHLWELEARPQPWMNGPEMAPLRRSFTVDDLAEAISGHDIAGTVVVQAVAEIAETVELLDLADRVPIIAGVVGFVDVSAGDVGEQIDQLLARPSGRWLVGIRSPVQYQTDADWLTRPAVLEGLRQVADRDLAHDLLIVPGQIDAALEAVRATPEGRFVVDHLAKPCIASGQVEPWASRLAALAEHDNVTAKLSGLVTEARRSTWTGLDLAPYTDHALGTFGPDRLLFGSDWPVCTLAATYGQVVATIDDLLGDLSPEERAAVFGGTATRVYSLSERIDPPRSHQGVS